MTNVNKYGYVTQPELLKNPVEERPTTNTWYYPSVAQKRAPRAFRCSNPDCGTLIERGSFYFRHNTGRYCSSCSTRTITRK